MSSGLVPVGQDAISIYRDPETVLAEAKKCAVSLKRVMEQKKNPVYFGTGDQREQYLEVEDWGTVAYFYGHTPKIVETEFVDYGEAGKGFKAVAVLLDREGTEVSRAEAMCLNSEDNWGMVTEYGWQDRLDANGKKIWNGKLRNGKGAYEADRVKIGEKQKPYPQLLSMAQTRAVSKVVSNKFRFVVVLAGYAGTPAEEMIGNEEPMNQDTAPREGPTHPPNVQRKSEKANQQAQAQGQTQGQAHDNGNKDPEATWLSTNGHDPKSHISFKQSRFYWVVAKKVEFPEEARKVLLKEKFNVEHFNLLPKGRFAEFLDLIDPDFTAHDRPKNQQGPPPDDDNYRGEF